jgi:hypothetical protein
LSANATQLQQAAEHLVVADILAGWHGGHWLIEFLGEDAIKLGEEAARGCS